MTTGIIRSKKKATPESIAFYYAAVLDKSTAGAIAAAG
jgi:hypothetical protein